MVKIAFTGGRDFEDLVYLREVCETIETFGIALWGKSTTDTLHVAVGCCPTGADRFIRSFFDPKNELFVPHTLTVFRADWTKLGRAAGPIRNRDMLSQFKPKVLVAFPGGDGTASCISIAKELTIPVRTYNNGKWESL